MSSESVQLIPSYANDIYGVYIQEGNLIRQVFSEARPVKSLTKITSKAMEQPLETGATIVDHRIILPVEIDIDLFLSSSVYRTTMDEIKQLYNNGSSLVVHSRSGIYDNLFIQDIPVEETAEKFDTLSIKMKLKEILVATASFQPINTIDQPTVSRGNISPMPASDEQTSTLGTTIGNAREPNPDLSN